MKVWVSFNGILIYGLLLSLLIGAMAIIWFNFQSINEDSTNTAKGIDDAQKVVDDVVQTRLDVQERLTRAREMLLLVRGSRERIIKQRARLNKVFLSNASMKAEDVTDSQNSIQILVDNFSNDVLVRGGEIGSWQERMIDQVAFVTEEYTWIKKQWLQRHAGLREKLLEVRRYYVYWTLKIANMLFIRSSIDELTPPDISSTELSLLMKSPDYSIWSETVPVFGQYIEQAREAETELFRATQKLDELTLEGHWSDAYTLYRDKFPPLTKQIGVSLDVLINNEELILERQRLCIQRANERADPVLNQMTYVLDQLSFKIEQFILRAQSDVISTQKHIQLELKKLGEQLTTMSQRGSDMNGRMAQLQFGVIVAGGLAVLFCAIMSFALVRSYRRK